MSMQQIKHGHRHAIPEILCIC